MSCIWNDFSGMPEALEKVSGIIRDSLVSSSPVINEGLSGLFNSGGKLLRPGLLIAAGRFGTLQEKHFKLAAALEMLHMATLIHDDVIDDSPLRRGLPSLHCRYGKKDAVLMGDFLLARSFTLATEYTSTDISLALAHVISLLCTMEIQQDTDRFTANTSLHAYLRKIMGKSALLFSLACFIGAHEAGLGSKLCQRFRRLGYNIGIAFQIIDDILDYSGEQALLGKALGSDIHAGIVTLPVICALRSNKSSVLNDIFSRREFTQEEAGIIFTQVQHYTGAQAAAEYASRYTSRALRDIAGLPPGENRNTLETLTNCLLVRQY